MNITHIIVLLTSSTDTVFVHTDLPSPYPPDVSTENAMLKFEVSHNKGVEYVKKHFGIEPEVINTRVT